MDRVKSGREVAKKNDTAKRSSFTKNDLRWYFPEFERHLGGCRFRDCLHLDEPGCAVRGAVEQAEVAPARYDTYRRILATLEG